MKPKYLSCLDGVRALAVSLVFVAHAGLGKLVPGGFGVTVFFFLSGYLITSLLRTEYAATGTLSLRNFYRRRALRILPPLYLAIALFWLLDLLPHSQHHTSLLGLSSLLFYFFNYGFPPHAASSQVPAGLGVAWSLMVEEHFYLLFPIAYFFMARRLAPRIIALLLSSLCIAALAWRCVLVFLLHTPLAVDHPWTYVATDCRFDSILWGCILAIAANPWCGDVRPWLARHRHVLATCGLLAIGCSLLWRNEAYRQTFRYTLQSVALLPIFFHIVSSPSAWQVRWLSWAPLRWLGWVSYSFYLVHFGVLEELHVHTTMSRGVIGLVALASSLALAELIRRTVELPLRHLAHARSGAKKSAPVSAIPQAA